MRRPHYLKANNSSEYPRHCIWFDTETLPIQVDEHTVKHVLNFGWACYRRRARGHQWSNPYWYRFTDLNDFWAWVTMHIDAKECYTLFAHNGSFDLPVLDAFGWFYNQGWQLVNAVIESPPIILKWRRDGKSIRFIDTLNIWRMSAAKIGESIGLSKLPMPDNDASCDEWDTYCKRDVEVIMDACIRWFDFIRYHDLGGFAPTLASQSMRAYRHRFMPTKILIDDNEQALDMARASYHGGRTECFFIGEVDGPLYQLDVNSMYPWVMQQSMMPTVLNGVYRRVKHLELAKLIKSHSVVAEVELSTDQPVFPQYQKGKLLFPIGEFETVLTTPELEYALEQGYVTHINHVAVYTQAIIFKEFVDYFYNLRQKAEEQGDNVAGFYLKIMMNSLYGKFGQRGLVYETVEQIDDTSIKSWVEIDADTKEVIKCRQFAGQRQELIDEPEARDSHPAIAAHVTAFARMAMWHIYQQAGLDNCYYTDTDCIVVNETGYQRLHNLIDDNTLGMLKLEQVIDRASIRGPKDYQFDSTARIKGVRKKAVWIDRNTVQQEQWSGLKGLMAKGDLTAPTTKTVIKHLKRQYTKGHQQPNGRIVPYRLG